MLDRLEVLLENPITATAIAMTEEFPDDMESCCSTPYVSAPSSPGRGTPLAGYYYSAPASPVHFVLSTTNLNSYPSVAAAAGDATGSFELDFDFSTTLPSTGATSPESMTSADELFLNGQIRPMKLSTHLQRPQLLAPLIESDDVVEDDQTFARGRDLKFRSGSLRRKTRSMSPMRNTKSFHCETDGSKRSNAHDANNANNNGEEKGSDETMSCASRSSSAGRSSKRWVFLKEFLYRSKSEGRNEGHKFWSSLSFSPVKDKQKAPPTSNGKVKEQNGESKKRAAGKNGAGKRVISPSPHELHYTAKRAQAEEMRKKTFLPYRQGLLGCLGFSSKSYGAMNGFAKAFNTVSSR